MSPQPSVDSLIDAEAFRKARWLAVFGAAVAQKAAAYEIRTGSSPSDAALKEIVFEAHMLAGGVQKIEEERLRENDQYRSSR